MIRSSTSNMVNSLRLISVSHVVFTTRPIAIQHQLLAGEVEQRSPLRPVVVTRCCAWIDRTRATTPRGLIVTRLPTSTEPDSTRSPLRRCRGAKRSGRPRVESDPVRNVDPCVGRHRKDAREGRRYPTSTRPSLRSASSACRTHTAGSRPKPLSRRHGQGHDWSYGRARNRQGPYRRRLDGRHDRAGDRRQTSRARP